MIDLKNKNMQKSGLTISDILKKKTKTEKVTGHWSLSESTQHMCETRNKKPMK